MVVTYTLLTLAVLSLWAGGETASPLRRNLWLLVLVSAIVAALLTYIIQPVALAWIAAMAVSTWTFARSRPGHWERWLAATGIVVFAAGLMTHFLPGFANPRVISGLRLSANSIPFNLYLNFDKTVAGVLILGWCHARMTRAADWRAMFRSGAPWAVGFMAVLWIVAFAAGYIRFDPKFPAETWLWMWVNLCFTCVAEEALFRGFIQAQLQRALANYAGGAGIALTVAAVSFGIAHANGGATYVFLSTLAGFAYGWVYQRTGRIEASILTHFALNTMHFLLFSYPALLR